MDNSPVYTSPPVAYDQEEEEFVKTAKAVLEDLFTRFTAGSWVWHLREYAEDPGEYVIDYSPREGAYDLIDRPTLVLVSQVVIAMLRTIKAASDSQHESKRAVKPIWIR